MDQKMAKDRRVKRATPVCRGTVGLEGGVSTRDSYGGLPGFAEWKWGVSTRDSYGGLPGFAEGVGAQQLGE